MTDVAAPSSAGLGRRLGALFYDAVLIFVLAMAETLVFFPFTGGAVERQSHPVAYVIYQIALLAMIAGFYGLFWVRGGQTLGMSAWRIKLVSDDGAPISWPLALRRFAFAWLTLGLGLLWVLVDRQKLALHDRWTKTRVIVLPKAR